MMIRRGRNSVARIDRTVRALVLLMGVALAGGRPAWAQGQDPSSAAQFHLGPAVFPPPLALQEIGVAANVVNASEGRERDFTWTLAPGLTGGLRMGRARLTGSANIDFVFFNKYTDQNSINGRYTARLEFALDVGAEMHARRSFRAPFAFAVGGIGKRCPTERQHQRQQKIRERPVHLILGPEIGAES